MAAAPSLARAMGALALLVGVLHTSRASAFVAPKAQVLIDRYVEATGGRAALDADTLVHVKGKLRSDGLDGTFDRWWHAPDRLLQAERAGTIRMRVGLDGEAGWRSDLTSRQIAPMEGADLAALRGEAWFASEQWARGGDGASIVAGPSAFHAGRSLESVEATAPSGLKKRLWFDDKTGLLARITHFRDQFTWTEDFGAWKTFAGRKRWTVATSGDSHFVASFRRELVDSVIAQAPAGGFAPPGSQLGPMTWLKTRGVASFPFRYRGGHVWVRASINGLPAADFILDTGCTASAVDRSWALKAGLPLEGETATQGVGGYDTGGYAHARTVRVSGANGDGVEVRDLKVVALELQDDLSSADWYKSAGLLGYDFLGRFVVELDFDRQVVTLYDPATWQHAGGGQGLPMQLYSNIPTVEVTLNARCKGRFIVDVGNATVMSVHTKQVEQCGLLGGWSVGKRVRHWVGGIGGAFPETVCRLDSVRIGPFAWEKPVAGLTLHTRGIVASQEIQGNLGTSVLERFKCTFDYAHGMLWLEPGAKYAQPDYFNRSGLWVRQWSGAIVVAAVVEKSPAEEAGLKVRDRLRAVNGVRIERWKPEDLEKVLESGAAGTVVKLTIERELVEQTLELTLADVL